MLMYRSRARSYTYRILCSEAGDSVKVRVRYDVKAIVVWEVQLGLGSLEEVAFYPSPDGGFAAVTLF